MILNLGCVEIDGEAGNTGVWSCRLESLEGIGDTSWVRGSDGDVDALLCGELRNSCSNAGGTAEDENGLTRDGRHGGGGLFVAG